MFTISVLRQFVKNGWTIANRRAIISQIGQTNFDEIVLLAKKSGRTGDIFRYADAKCFFKPNEMQATKEALSQTNILYHGSPFSFESFDVTKIGTDEGMNKYCKGLYLSRTKHKAPFYANIRSTNAPIHFGCTKHVSNANPTVYTVQGSNNLNLKLCSTLEAKKITVNQEAFQSQYPDIDGIELLGGDVTIFPQSVHKLSILKREGVIDFVKNNRNYNFREWTTDITKLNSIYQA